MCTSVELRDGTRVELRVAAYDSPVAQDLVARVQQEYVIRYGGPDAAVVDPAEFVPPVGSFFVASVDGVPAGCGAWRVHGPGVVEIKRVFVDAAFRRRGLAEAIMAALEDSAARAGFREAVLYTGPAQPEALALYDRLGYRPATRFGAYAEVEEAIFLGKPLGAVAADPFDTDVRSTGEDEEERPWAS
jgi:GNAT superfamily N-acetyltransferase